MPSFINMTTYIDTLSPKHKRQYLMKIQQYCEGIVAYVYDQWELKPHISWPTVMYGDIYNFLLAQTSFYSAQQMKAFKSLEAYNFFFISGWVIEMQKKNIAEQ